MPTASINDIEMHYEDRGSGEPLMLLHGFTGSSSDWVHLFDLDALAAQYRVIAPDARAWPLDESLGELHAPPVRARSLRAARSPERRPVQGRRAQPRR